MTSKNLCDSCLRINCVDLKKWKQQFKFTHICICKNYKSKTETCAENCKELDK